MSNLVGIAEKSRAARRRVARDRAESRHCIARFSVSKLGSLAKFHLPAPQPPARS